MATTTCSQPQAAQQPHAELLDYLLHSTVLTPRQWKEPGVDSGSVSQSFPSLPASVAVAAHTGMAPVMRYTSAPTRSKPEEELSSLRTNAFYSHTGPYSHIGEFRSHLKNTNRHFVLYRNPAACGIHFPRDS